MLCESRNSIFSKLLGFFYNKYMQTSYMKGNRRLLWREKITFHKQKLHDLRCTTVAQLLGMHVSRSLFRNRPTSRATPQHTLAERHTPATNANPVRFATVQADRRPQKPTDRHIRLVNTHTYSHTSEISISHPSPRCLDDCDKSKPFSGTIRRDSTRSHLEHYICGTRTHKHAHTIRANVMGICSAHRRTDPL